VTDDGGDDNDGDDDDDEEDGTSVYALVGKACCMVSNTRYFQ
jgi:hypothetical protein